MIALGLAGFWAYTTFVYPEVYRPEDYQNYLALSSEILSVDFVEEIAFVRLNLTATNSSKTLLRNVAAHYQISGFQIADEKSKWQNVDVNALAKKLNQDSTTLSGGRSKSIATEDIVETLDVGLLMSSREWLVAGEAFERTILVAVPCKIDGININVSVVHQNDQPYGFRPKWNVTNKGNLWFKLEAKIDDEPGEWQLYDRNNNSHKELKEDRGLLQKYHMAELIIPWPKYTKRCKPTGGEVER